MTKLNELLGKDAEALLGYQAKGFPKANLHLPGPDFVDRIVAQTDRTPQVLRNFQARSPRRTPATCRSCRSTRASSTAAARRSRRTRSTSIRRTS
jgi:hypothetical protein